MRTQRALARTTLPAIPIVVLTKDRPFDVAGLAAPAEVGEKLDAAWRRAQRRLAASIAQVPITVVEMSHNISIERPDVVVDAIRPSSRPSGAFSGAPAITGYAKLTGQNVETAKYIVKEFASKTAAQLDEIKGGDRVLAQALAAKRIPHALTHNDIRGAYDLVLKQGS